MRCKACDNILQRADLVINPHTKSDDDLCRQCRGVVFAALLVDLEEDEVDDMDDMCETADGLHEGGAPWVEPSDLT